MGLQLVKFLCENHFHGDCVHVVFDNNLRSATLPQKPAIFFCYLALYSFEHGFDYQEISDKFFFDFNGKSLTDGFNGNNEYKISFDSYNPLTETESNALELIKDKLELRSFSTLDIFTKFYNYLKAMSDDAKEYDWIIGDDHFAALPVVLVEGVKIILKYLEQHPEPDFRLLLSRFIDNLIYTEEFAGRLDDEKVEKLWTLFGDTPVNEDDELDEDFLEFIKGTDRMEVWEWFDDIHSRGVAYLQGQG